ncbi:hypothetical protein QQS21_011341 [Conoideocrella luteorostrata]|uniref:Uncharacterized protein n=1 Tax=Conoideocrella luteorostrata TaxID=1105319 RepID=A0AAJ0FNN4_9HYPO|nr:hypothetical protein QQS21_011341 [Conoideocrella luteorostrata]
MGFSMELSQPAKTSQLMSDGKLDKELYEDTVTKKPPGPGCGRNDAYEKTYYGFQMRLGNPQRVFDGLVCYFKPKPAEEQDRGCIGPEHHVYPSVPMGPSSRRNFRRPRILPTSTLPPYNIDPLTDTKRHQAHFPGIRAPDQRQASSLWSFADTFSATHAYSGVLPVKELALPDWTWQGPISQISAVFHAGPVPVTRMFETLTRIIS